MKLAACLLFFASTLLTSGCAFAPPIIDVSNSIHRPAPSLFSGAHVVSRVVIRNEASNGKLVNTGLGSDSLFPIVPDTPTKATVEEDLRRFMTEVLTTQKVSTKSLIVTITVADSYWVWGGAAKIPILGLAAVGVDTEFGLNLRVLFEIEDGGKVVGNYLYDQKITMQGKATTGEAIQESYRALIAEYRKRFFLDIESRFLTRYL